MLKNRYFIHQLFLWLGLLTATSLLPIIAWAQEADTTKRELDLNNEQRKIFLRQQFERQASGGIMTEMGTYRVPNEKQYYSPPFKGQYYLDMAVEAYRKELENKIGNNWYWQFLKAVSPYINNQFEFGVYQINDIEFVDRDHPLFQSDQ